MDQFTNLVLSQSSVRYASDGGSGKRSLAMLSVAYLGAEVIGCDYLIGMLRATGILHLPNLLGIMMMARMDGLHAWEVGLNDAIRTFDLLLLLVLEVANTFLSCIISMQAPAFVRKLCSYDKKPILLKYRSSKWFITSTVCFAIFSVS